MGVGSQVIVDGLAQFARPFAVHQSDDFVSRQKSVVQKLRHCFYRFIHPP